MAVPLLGPKARFFDANGNPLSGGKVQTYEAGTTTPKNSYTDSSGAVANTNPVILDSQGYANIWLGEGNYKIVLLNSADVVQWTVDNYAGDVATGFAGTVFPLSSNTSIVSSYNNSVLICTNTINLNLLNASTAGQGFVFTAYNAGTGIITIDPSLAETINGQATLTLNPGQSAMVVCDGSGWYGLFRVNSGNATVGTIPVANGSGDFSWTNNMSTSLNFAKGADLASAATVNIGAATGNYVTITGTTTITAFDTVQAGAVRFLRFAGILTLTYNATSLILPGTANITTAAGDVAIMISEGSGNWRCVSYNKANGQAVGLGNLDTNSMIHVQDQKASGTNGGTTTNTTTHTRTLNATVRNTITGSSLASNQVTLPVGTYYIDADAPGYSATAHKCRLYNVTDAAYVLEGTSEFSTNVNGVATRSRVTGFLTVSGSAKVFELRQYFQTGQVNVGFGSATGQGTEIYADFKAWKIA